MGIMTFLRERAGYILVGTIGFSIVAFLVGDAISVGSPFWADSQRVVGTIDGVDVKIEDFSPKVEENLNRLKQQYGMANGAQLQSMAVDNAWNAEMSNILLKKEYERLGLTISGDELFDLLQGENPSPIIVQYFGNKQTGQIDRATIINSLKEQTKNAELKKQWDMLKDQIEKEALQNKYSNLVRNSVYVTSLEANDEHINRNKLANFKYVALDYSSVADNSIKLTDEDYSDYYAKNKKRFENPVETRSFNFVSFPLKASKEDSLAIKQNIEKLALDFKTTKNDSLFAAVNSDVQVPYAYLAKSNLPSGLDSVVFNYPAGSYYGPKLIGNSYRLIKIVGARISPDSVKASHILLDPAKMGGLDKAKKTADSLKAVVLGGGDFAQLASIYGTDGTKEKGGSLGTFGRGNMVAEFEDAAFGGRIGEIKIVTTQFGVHLIKIENQKGSSKVVKLAYIEKAIAPSTKTQTAAYRLAQSFFTDLKPESFNSAAKSKGLTVALAENVSSSQGYVQGMLNPRQLIREGYEAKQGEVLPQVYQMDDSYVVARLISIKPKGTLALEEVKKDIEPMVRNAAKAKILVEKLNNALKGTNDLNAVAQKLGKVVTPVQNVVFANPIIPGLAQENKVVGAVFGSQPNKVSAAIEGQSGVFAISVDGFLNPSAANVASQKQMMVSSSIQKTLNATFQALQDKSAIKDNRVKFY
ncbi:MAG: SurA N-terminal domain-containing protein [Sphingobacteriaceae bacterium]|nr:SurA N-terminal domain-containing protein [Sphingobacteriaceae bacterium]